MFSEQDLNKIVNEISENYANEELFYMKEGHQMPDRNCIVHIIMGLREITFPGYFDKEHLGENMPQFFLGHKLTSLYRELYTQIQSALLQQGKCSVNEIEIREQTDKICSAFFAKFPKIQNMILKDVQAAFDGDPAARSKEEIIFCYPGLLAVFIYRFAHELYVMKVPFIPRIMTEYAHAHTGIDINPGATIGEYFFIDHGTGVVIGETTSIGNYVKVYQGVTLGALSTRSGQLLRDVKRHPTIEDNVTIYSNSSILGGETVIGKGSVIGGNAFITESIPAGSRVSVKDQDITITEKRKKKNGLFE